MCDEWIHQRDLPLEYGKTVSNEMTKTVIVRNNTPRFIIFIF